MADAGFHTIQSEMKRETLDVNIANHLSYRDYREAPASPSSSSVTTVISAGDNPFTPETPGSVQDEAADHTLITCPDSPPGNLFNKKDERIHNDLLDELCTDMGLKDAMELDFFDELEENYIDQFMATEDCPSTSGTPSGLMSPVSHASSNSQGTDSKDQNKTPMNMTPSGSRMHSAAPSPERERKNYDNNKQEGVFKSPHKPPPRSLPQQPIPGSNPGSQYGSTPSTPTRKSVTFAGQYEQPGNNLQRPTASYPNQQPQGYRPGQGYPAPTDQQYQQGQAHQFQGQPRPQGQQVQGQHTAPHQHPSQGPQMQAQQQVQGHITGHQVPQQQQVYGHQQGRPSPHLQGHPPNQQYQSPQTSQHGKSSVWSRPTNVDEKPRSTMHYKPSMSQAPQPNTQQSMQSNSQTYMSRYPVKQENIMHRNMEYQNRHCVPGQTNIYPVKREVPQRSMSTDNNQSFDCASIAPSDLLSDQGYSSCDLASTNSRPSSRATTTSQYSSMESVSVNGPPLHGHGKSSMYQHSMHSHPEHPHVMLQKQQSLPSQPTIHDQQFNTKQLSQQQLSHKPQSLPQNPLIKQQDSKPGGLKSPLQKLAELNQSITDDYNQHIIEKTQVGKGTDSGSDGDSPPLQPKVEASTVQSSCSMAEPVKVGFPNMSENQCLQNPGDVMGQDPLYPNRSSIKRLNNGTEKSIGEIDVYNGVSITQDMDWNNLGAKPKSVQMQYPGYVSSQSQPGTPCDQFSPVIASQWNGPGEAYQQQQYQQMAPQRAFHRSHSYPTYTNESYAPDQTMQFNTEGQQYDYPMRAQKGYPQQHGYQNKQLDMNQNMPYMSCGNPMQMQQQPDGYGQRPEAYSGAICQQTNPSQNKNCSFDIQGAVTMQNPSDFDQTAVGNNPPPYNYAVQGNNSTRYTAPHNGHYAQSHTPPIRHHPYGNGDRSRQPPTYGQYYQQPNSCAFDGQPSPNHMTQQYMSHQAKLGHSGYPSDQSNMSMSSVETQVGSMEANFPGGSFDPQFSSNNNPVDPAFHAANQFTPIQPPTVQPGDAPPPDWPPTQSDKISISQHSFMQRIVSDKSSAFRSHPLFPLLRDLIVADMNFHNSSFPYQLISSLPTDFNRLLQNYLQRTPPAGEYQSNHAIDSVVMDSLKYAHKSLIEKIQQKKDEETFGQSTGPMSAIEDFCSKFDQAVRNSMTKDDMNGHNQYMAHPPEGLVSACNPQDYYKDMNRMNSLEQCAENNNNNSDADSIKSGKSAGTGKNAGEVRKHPVLPKEAVAVMLSWLKEHRDKPYPSDEEKSYLMEQTKLTINQINYWFVNARRRILPKWKQLEAEGKTITIKTK